MMMKVIHFCSLNQKNWVKVDLWTTVYALHKWLILIFSRTTKASNSQISTEVVPEGLVTSYFRSAANRITVFILGRHFSVTVQPISIRCITALERVMKVFHYLLCAPCKENNIDCWLIDVIRCVVR